MTEHRAEGGVRRFAAYSLMAAGWLIVITAGLCTGAVVLMGLPGLLSSGLRNILDAAMLPLVFGGVPILGGVGLIFLGRRMRGNPGRDGGFD